MLKNIAKNRVKTCSVCKFDGTGSRAKTCTSEETGKRCGGEWIEVIKPEAKVQIIIDDVSQVLKDNVVDTLDNVARGIAAEVFPRNLNACEKGWGRCAFYNLCHKRDDSDLIKGE